MARILASKLVLVCVLGATLMFAACDHDQASPATPSAGPQPGPTAVTARTIEGTIEGLAAPGSLVVSGTSIQLAPDAVIRSGSMGLTFADLRLGARSRVTADFDGTTYRAALIEVMDVVGTPTFLHGAVSGLTVDRNGFQFRIGNQLVRGNADTPVFMGSRPATASSLREGGMVDVNGLQRTEYAFATNVTVNGADPAPTPSPGPTPMPNPSPNPNPTPSPSPSPSPSPLPSPLPNPVPSPVPSPGPSDVTVSGTVLSVSGSCPAISFTTSGSSVVTNNNTDWSGGACASLAPGAHVDATGAQNGNTVVARQVTFR